MIAITAEYQPLLDTIDKLGTAALSIMLMFSKSLSIVTSPHKCYLNKQGWIHFALTRIEMN